VTGGLPNAPEPVAGRARRPVGGDTACGSLGAAGCAAGPAAG